MNILYLDNIFPRVSKTFITHEILGLTKKGHIVKVFAKNREKGIFHKDFKILEDNTLYPSVSFYPHLNALTIFIGVFFADLFTNPLRAFKTVKFAMFSKLDDGTFFHNYLDFHFISKFKPDIIHAAFANPMLLRNAYALSLYFNVPFTFSFRTYEFFRYKNRKKLPNLKKVIDKAGIVFTISDYNKKFLIKKIGIKKPIKVIRSAIDCNYFKLIKHLREKNRILFVGRFDEQKGIPYLLDACNLLQDRGLNLKLVLMGQNDKETEDLESEYKGYVRKKKIQNICFKGQLTRENVRKELSKAAVFVLPCIIAEDGDRDMAPNAIKEAMAMEVPVVTTRMGGIDELIKNGKTGILVAQKNAPELADAIEGILKGRISLNLKEARKEVCKKFNIETESILLEKAFLDIIKQGKS